MSKRPVAMNCFSGRDKLVGFACHPKSRSFLSQMQTRSKSRYDKFSNWSLFRHKTAICQKLTFHFTETLFLMEDRQRQGWKSTWFVTVYLPGSSVIKSWMRWLAGFRATRAPRCLTPACDSQDSLPLTREPQEPTKLLNKTKIILLVSLATPTDKQQQNRQPPSASHSSSRGSWGAQQVS